MIRATSQYKKDRQRRALACEREHSEVHQLNTSCQVKNAKSNSLPSYEPNRHSGRHHHRPSNLPRRVDAMGQKRAVLVGINYAGTDGELKGCLNDVARMRRCLVDRFGFDEVCIRVLADADPSTPPPTGANNRLELERLVTDARPEDFLFFHYSGHGLQLPAETGEDDDTGYDECIVTCDLNLIKGELSFCYLAFCCYL
jgi:hypothetical protein